MPGSQVESWVGKNWSPWWKDEVRAGSTEVGNTICLKLYCKLFYKSQCLSTFKKILRK